MYPRGIRYQKRKTNPWKSIGLGFNEIFIIATPPGGFEVECLSVVQHGTRIKHDLPTITTTTTTTTATATATATTTTATTTTTLHK